MMNTKNNFASHLAKFLRLNGDKVMNGATKLTLTTTALCMLNNLFDTILFAPDGSEVLSFSGTTHTEELFEDVKFMFDFVRKISSLKVSHGMQTLRGGIDVSRFINLNTLELHKVPMHLVIGLNSLCPQLEVLICHRSICFLKEIFSNAEVELSLKEMWTGLKELDIAYNYLEGFDQSFGILPNLEYINASHNNLKHIDEIQMLEKLVFVNLSYNLLENVPVLSNFSSYSLRVLLMRNNILEDLEGLEMLPSLEKLDVSYNCISEHSALRSLKCLQMLKSLNLEGNPIYFHTRHRILTTRYLHTSVVSRGVLLNRKFMDAEEFLCTMRKNRSSDSFCVQNLNTHQTAINVIIEDVENNRLMPEQSGVTFKYQEVAFGSDEDSICNMEEQDSTNEIANFEALAVKLPKKRKKKKSAQNDQPLLSAVLGEGNSSEQMMPAHIRSKQLLETRREEYKEGWLIPTESFQQLVCDNGNISAPPNTPASNSVDKQPAETLVQVSTVDLPISVCVTSVEFPNEEVKVSEETSGELKELDSSNEDKKLLSDNCDDIEVLVPHFQETRDPAPLYYDFHRNCSYNINNSAVTNDVFENSDSSDDSDEESEGGLFFVEANVCNKCQSLCIMIKENYIKEIDTLSGKVSDRLDLHSLTSINIDKDDSEAHFQLRLTFDTTKASRQKRIYVFESMESAQAMYVKLKPFADARVLEHFVVGALQCLKCSSTFSKEVAEKKVVETKHYGEKNLFPDNSKNFLKETPVCPNCASTLVFEVETMPLPSVPSPSDPDRKITTLTSNLQQKPKIAAEDLYLPSSIYSGSKSVPEINESKRKEPSATKTAEKGISEDHSTNQTNVSNSTEKLKSHVRDSNSSLPLKTRQNSSHSNQSSSITVISDTESNLDVISENTSVSSPLPTQFLHQSKDFLTTLLTEPGVPPSAVVTPVSTSDGVCYSDVREKGNFSSSVTESLGNECSKNFYMTGKELEISDFESKMCPPENINLMSLFEEKEQFNCETFTSIDHRLKLHLEVGIFDNDETLLACLQAGVVPMSSGTEFGGLLVISSKKLYIMSFQVNDSDGFEKSLKQIFVCPLKQLNVIQIFLGGQCLSITCGSDNKVFIFLVRDADLCNCFTSHLKDIISERFQGTDVPVFMSDAEESLAQINSEIISTYEKKHSIYEESEILLHLFGYWSLAGQYSKQPVCFIVTTDSIFVADVKFKKRTKRTESSSLFYYVPLQRQKLSDLIEVKLEEDFFSAEILFKDEEKNIATQWIVSTRTKSSLFSFISAFKTPWDGIFGIELPLSLHSE